jgi:2-hydroxychromene-2-carboxylate isomerase
LGGVISIKSHKKQSNKQSSHHNAEHATSESHKPKGRISRPSQDSSQIWKIASIALAILLIFSIYTHGFSDINISFEKSDKTDTKIAKGDGVDKPLDVELYVMSQCPYGVQAQAGIIPAVQELGEENFNLAIEFISTDLGNGQFNSLHGEPETKGNIVQLCAEDVDDSKYLDLILCMNKDMSSIPNNWKACAESLGYDIAKVEACYEGEKGKELLSASVVNTNTRGATGSPTIYIGDQLYTGARDVMDFKRAFCTAFEGEKPEGCSDVPAPKEFELIVLNDKSCAGCSTTDILSATRNFFPGVQVREVDVLSPEGNTIINTYGIEVVPTYIFDAEVVETEIWADTQFQTNFQQLADGNYKLIDEVTGSTYYIDDEKRAARLKDMGITPGDNRPQIDFFTMSYCPYGTQAVQAITGAFDLLKDYADFNPHYIYYAGYNGGGPEFCLDDSDLYCAMHGIVEARQNVREQCVQEKYGIEGWFDFANEMISSCSASNANTCYVTVAEGLGFDADYIAQCEQEKAVEFAAKDAQMMSLFGASGSPTIYIDGVEYVGPRTPTGYQAALCAAFEQAPAVCDGIVVQEDDLAQAVDPGSC